MSQIFCVLVGRLKFAPGGSGTSNWVPAFKNTSIHGVFLLASDSEFNLDVELALLKGILGSSASEKYILKGNVRPGSQQGHERTHGLS